MEIFGKEVIIGNFRSSDYALITVSESGKSSDGQDKVFEINTETEFIGDNPVAVYNSQNYKSGMSATVTFCKNVCDPRASDPDWLAFTEYECRAIVRQVTGIPGWQWITVIPEEEVFTDGIWYRGRVSNVQYGRITSKIYTITLEIEFDSYMGYTEEQTNTVSVGTTAKSIYVITDDLNNYVLPTLTLIPKSSGTLQFTNKSDGSGWTTQIKNVTANSVIKMDCAHKILTGISLNNFNMHWPRLVDNENTYVANMNVQMQFTYRLPRKVGLIVR